MSKVKQQQIAREAAEEWFRDFEPPGDIPGKATLQSIIHSAIERGIQAFLCDTSNPSGESSEPGAPFPSIPQPSKARKEQAPRAQGSPASGERSELRDNEGRSLKDIQEWEQAGHDADDPTMIVSPRGQRVEGSCWIANIKKGTKWINP